MSMTFARYWADNNYEILSLQRYKLICYNRRALRTQVRHITKMSKK